MAGLQRSGETFRRSGSSGLVWEDKLFSGDLNQMKKKEEGGVEFSELRHSNSVGSVGMLERSRSKGERQGYRTGEAPPDLDPPSPKVNGCGLICGIFRKPEPQKKAKRSNPTRR